MWCVASAPIVPLARDLDAALGMRLSELAVHFRKLSTPLLTAPLPSPAHPRFFRTPPTPLLTHPLPSRAAPAFLPHTAHAAPHSPTPLSGSTRVSCTRCPATPTLCRLVSAPSRTCATSRPAARLSLRAATAAMGTFFRKHKKTSTVPKGAVLVLDAKRSTFGRVG